MTYIMAQIEKYLSLVKLFRGRILPEEAMLVGYAALINSYDLQVPLPETLAAISLQHRRYGQDSWEIYTPRHAPSDTLGGHLVFALRYEGVDLAILSALFDAILGHEIYSIVANEPTGNYSRRIWFLYEWLSGKELKLKDIDTGNFVDVLNPKQYYTSFQGVSKRHRVNNNLPGVRNFCPLVRRTPKLESYIKKNLFQLARQRAEDTNPELLTRSASFLLLKDSRASFAIEGEHPTQSRAERWGRVIGHAGEVALSVDELLRLQKIVLTDNLYVKFGLRKEGGFIGMHDRSSGVPIPDHISAKWTDLDKLMGGLLDTDKILRNGAVDAVISAAIISFGFVFIHPFEDGNGRIHRYLMHHVLAEHRFIPRNMVFPISSIMLEQIDSYRKVLEFYSKPRLEFIQWNTTNNGNVNVSNDTINLYRYFDATMQAEFFYDCVDQTITNILPAEIKYLQHYDKLKNAISQNFDMPDYKVSLLIRFLEQNDGKFSRRAKAKEFHDITEEEMIEIEELYKKLKLFPG